MNFELSGARVPADHLLGGEEGHGLRHALSALECSLASMRVHGGMGYSTDLDVERLCRDAPLLAIGEGTNDILRMVIARQLIRAD